MHALEYDIKPVNIIYIIYFIIIILCISLLLYNSLSQAFGTSAEQIERLISQGIIRWGEPVTDILEDGQLFIQQTKSEGSRGLVSVLLEGKFMFINFVFSNHVELLFFNLLH